MKLCRKLKKYKFLLVDRNDRRNAHIDGPTQGHTNIWQHFMMIDNEDKAQALMEKMKAALPIRARLLDDTRKSMQRQGTKLPTNHLW